MISELEMTPHRRELTYGEKAVGLTFNPSGDETVTKIKKLFAEIIDVMNDLRSGLEHPIDAEKARLCSIAITEAQAAQMWCIKAVTWR